MFATIRSSRSSSESSCSADSMYSERSQRCRSPSYLPPSISYGGPTKPFIELNCPLFELSSSNSTVVVSGEIEVDISMFRRGEHVLPFSIGIHLTPNSPAVSDESDSEDDEFRGEWNQDGPGNYYRRRSCIQIHPRLIVDDICYVKFTITVPHMAMPQPKGSRIFNVAVKAYELGDPYNVTEASTARFMVLNRLGSDRTSDRMSMAVAQPKKKWSIRYGRLRF